MKKNNVFLSTTVVGAVIISNQQDGIYVLAGKKGQHWQLPQGSDDPNDNENFQTAVYREILEETGIKKTDIMHIQTAYQTVSYHMKSHGRIPHAQVRSVKWFLFAIKNMTDINLTPDIREFEELDWIPWPEFMEKCAPHKRKMYMFVERFFYHYLTPLPPELSK